MRGKCIVILDGNGENRRAMENALDDLGVRLSDRPTVITLELNANVALAGALRRRAALWAVAHVGSSEGGFAWLVERVRTQGAQPEHRPPP